jgi:hypothetical protein
MIKFCPHGRGVGRTICKCMSCFLVNKWKQTVFHGSTFISKWSLCQSGKFWGGIFCYLNLHSLWLAFIVYVSCFISQKSICWILLICLPSSRHLRNENWQKKCNFCLYVVYNLVEEENRYLSNKHTHIS